MLQKIHTKRIISWILLLSLAFGITFADDQLDVKNDINNMRNAVKQPWILWDIFTKVFDTNGKIKEVFMYFTATATEWFLPLWSNLNLIDSPIFSTWGLLWIWTTTLTEELTLSWGLSISWTPDSWDDVGNRDYNDSRYLFTWSKSADSDLLDWIDSSWFIQNWSFALNDLSDAITDWSSLFIWSWAWINDDGSNNNVSLWLESLQTNTSWIKNIALWRYSLQSNVSWNNNTAVWFDSLKSNSTWSLNVAIWYQAWYSEIGSNKLYIDNSNTTTPLIYWDFATDEVTIYWDLTVTGSILTTSIGFTSDRRLKTNIVKIDSSLDKLTSLNWYTYNWKNNWKSDIWVIAQEVQKVFPNLVNIHNTTWYLSVKYANFIAPVIEALKELNINSNKQEEEIETLKNEILELKELMNKHNIK